MRWIIWWDTFCLLLILMNRCPPSFFIFFGKLFFLTNQRILLYGKSEKSKWISHYITQLIFQLLTKFNCFFSIIFRLVIERSLREWRVLFFVRECIFFLLLVLLNLTYKYIWSLASTYIRFKRAINLLQNEG